MCQGWNSCWEFDILSYLGCLHLSLSLGGEERRGGEGFRDRQGVRMRVDGKANRVSLEGRDIGGEGQGNRGWMRMGSPHQTDGRGATLTPHTVNVVKYAYGIAYCVTYVGVSLYVCWCVGREMCVLVEEYVFVFLW